MTISFESTQPSQFMPVQQPGRAGAQNEFATLFYREILKQSFENGIAGTGDGVYGDITKEILINKLAEALAKKNAQLLPNME